MKTLEKHQRLAKSRVAKQCVELSVCYVFRRAIYCSCGSVSEYKQSPYSDLKTPTITKLNYTILLNFFSISYLLIVTMVGLPCGQL